MLTPTTTGKIEKSISWRNSWDASRSQSKNDSGQRWKSQMGAGCGPGKLMRTDTEGFGSVTSRSWMSLLIDSLGRSHTVKDRMNFLSVTSATTLLAATRITSSLEPDLTTPQTKYRRNGSPEEKCFQPAFSLRTPSVRFECGTRALQSGEVSKHDKTPTQLVAWPLSTEFQSGPSSMPLKAAAGSTSSRSNR